MYQKCTNAGHDQLWCATQTDSAHNYIGGNYRNCGNCKDPCYNEEGFHYPGNDLNNGFENRQTDREACRLSCRSISGAEFFDWVSPDFSNSQYHNGCWCKNSDAGRRPSSGITSGNVNCLYATGTRNELPFWNI